MFTGIIQEIGTIARANKQGEGVAIRVEAPLLSPKLNIGDSISINGACQTAVTVGKNWFEVCAMAETVKRTNFKNITAGTKANLELPLSLNDLLGGHLAAGHVDDVGIIKHFEPSGSDNILRISFKPEYRKYLIEKGSAAIDGISLTVFDIKENMFSISYIPETLTRTNLQYRRVGDEVNLEFDLIGKYIENFVSGGKGGVTMEFLSQHGFTR